MPSDEQCGTLGKTFPACGASSCLADGEAGPSSLQWNGGGLGWGPALSELERCWRTMLAFLRIWICLGLLYKYGLTLSVCNWHLGDMRWLLFFGALVGSGICGRDKFFGWVSSELYYHYLVISVIWEPNGVMKPVVVELGEGLGLLNLSVPVSSWISHFSLTPDFFCETRASGLLRPSPSPQSPNSGSSPSLFLRSVLGISYTIA